MSTQLRPTVCYRTLSWLKSIWYMVQQCSSILWHWVGSQKPVGLPVNLATRSPGYCCVCLMLRRLFFPALLHDTTTKFTQLYLVTATEAFHTPKRENVLFSSYAWISRNQPHFGEENRFSLLEWTHYCWEMHQMLLSSWHCPYLALAYWGC